MARVRLRKPKKRRPAKKGGSTVKSRVVTHTVREVHAFAGARMPKLVSPSFQTPKGCHVRSAELRADGVLVSYDCGDGGRGSFPTPGGGMSNYPKALVKGARSIDHAGAHIYGVGSSVGFVLSPRYVRCAKLASDRVLRCNLYNQAGLLAGRRR